MDCGLVKDRVRLTGNGIDFKALKAGQDVEFEYDPKNDEDNFNWEDENDKPIDYEKIFMYRNMDMINCEQDNPDEVAASSEEGESCKTPFEMLRLKMTDITSDKDNGVVKRVLENGSGLVITKGSRVRSIF